MTDIVVPISLSDIDFAHAGKPGEHKDVALKSAIRIKDLLRIFFIEILHLMYNLQN
jgi:hypothetical protein